MIKKLAISSLILLTISGCSTRTTRVYDSHAYSSSKSAYSPSVTQKSYNHPTMRPYVVRGKKYYPTVVKRGQTFYGRASWYGPKFHGRLTSSGERYDMYKATAAHKTLPMNTIVKVTNQSNGKSTIVRINDRGPFVGTRIIDLSKKAAQEIDMVGHGTTNVKLEVLGFQKDGSRSIPTQQALKKGVQEKVVGEFSIQLAAFTKFDGAKSVQKKYDGHGGYHTIIKDSNENGRRLFRVYLTGFKSDQEARDYIANSDLAAAFIVREN